jgi:hypothetical protein
MKIVSRILARAARLPFTQEYLCLDDTAFPERLHVYETLNGVVRSELTQTHLFVGYSPLLLAFPAGIEHQEHKTLLFTSTPQRSGERPPLASIIATLQLKRSSASGPGYVLYEGIFARHRLLSPWKQWWIDQHNRYCKQDAGNLFLAGNRYRQVQVAYALPRAVSLICVQGPGGCNLFPTDLHGALPGAQYLISLRHGGKACEQVQAAGELLLSHMEPARAGTVYSLGKNHMQPLGATERFRFSGSFKGYPVPEGAVRVRRLVLEGYEDSGIHRLLRFRVAGEQAWGTGGSLAHVHAAYAAWRRKRGLAGNYFPR